MFIHRQTASKQCIVVLFYISFAISLGSDNIKTTNANFKGGTKSASAAIGIARVQVSKTDNLYTMYLTKMMGRVFQPKSHKVAFALQS